MEQMDLILSKFNIANAEYMATKPDLKGMSFSEKFEAVSEALKNSEEKGIHMFQAYEEMILALVKHSKKIIITGPPGIGKLYFTQRVFSDNGLLHEFVVFDNNNANNCLQHIQNNNGKDFIIDVDYTSVHNMNNLEAVMDMHKGTIVLCITPNSTTPVSESLLSKCFHINF